MRSLIGGPRGSRGALQIGLVALVGALAAGAVIGSGLAQTVLSTPDPLTWLRNDRGQVTRVNPETGTLIDRLQVGGPGDPLRVVQGDGGVLVVTNLRTNEVTIVDLSLLRVTGTRLGDPGAVKILLVNRRLYLVGKRTGQIELVDPLTATTVGQPWRAGEQLADVAADSGGTVWALGRSGRLVALQWPDGAGGFVVRDGRAVPDAGGDAVLVAHERGVTVFDPRGSVTRVGTGKDRALRAGRLAAPLVGADSSPVGLAPVASPETSAIRLVRDDRVVEVNGSTFGCRKPDQTAVYRDRVYVACRGDRKVIVLDAGGRRAKPDLATGGDPELVLNAGLLIVNVPSAATGLVVKPDGTIQQIRTDDPTVAVHDPSARPTALPPGLGIRTPRNRPSTRSPANEPGTGPAATQGPAPGGGQTPGPGGGTGPTTVAPTPPAPTTAAPTTQAPRPQDYTPTGVTAEARPDSSIHVTWVPPAIEPGSYRILRSDTGEQVGTTLGGVTSAIITGQTLGQPVSFIVAAVSAAGSFQSLPSNPVAAFGRPGGPTIQVVLAARSPTALTMRVTVDVVTDGGSAVTAYDLAVTSEGGRGLLNVQGVPIGQRPYQFTATCTGSTDLCVRGGSVTATATLHNAAGAGPPGTASDAIPAPPPFLFGESFMYVSSGGKCLDFDIRLHTCTGSAGQLWVHTGNNSAIRNRINNNCLAVNDDLHLARDGCTDDPKKFSRINVVGNEAMIFSPPGGECIRVMGDPAGEGVQVLDRKQCINLISERWTAWQQQPGVPMTAAQPAASVPPAAGSSASDGALGIPGTTVLLVPLAVGLARRRQRRRRVR